MAPVVSKLKLRPSRHGARVTLTLSEAAAVTIRFKRGKEGVAHGAGDRAAGHEPVTVRSSRLERGRYAV